MLRNLTPVVKNILLINVLMLIVTFFGHQQEIPVTRFLGGYEFGSPFFKPFQIVTHFFMHGGPMHLLFNMFALVIFGSALEQRWGPKRFFMFYFITAIGAFILFQLIGYFEVINIRGELSAAGINYVEIHDTLRSGYIYNSNANQLILEYQDMINTPLVGASGAVFGVLVAFAFYFPNTELYLLFFPFPIKAKYLVGGYIVLEIIQTLRNSPGDNVAHLAHITGALVGFIIVYYWQKTNKNFY